MRLDRQNGERVSETELNQRTLDLHFYGPRSQSFTLTEEMVVLDLK
jgi:hypothetical protein